MLGQSQKSWQLCKQNITSQTGNKNDINKLQHSIRVHQILHTIAKINYG